MKFLTVENLTPREAERIFARISIDLVTGCWNWTGSTDGRYGAVRFRGDDQKAHRLVYACLIGPLPIVTNKDTPILDHVVCNNTLCCNPAHVELKPQRLNVLRGNGPTAQNARKTHCKRGHLLPVEPIRPDGTRYCTIYVATLRNSPEGKAYKRAWALAHPRQRRKPTQDAGAHAHAVTPANSPAMLE